MEFPTTGYTSNHRDEDCGRRWAPAEWKFAASSALPWHSHTGSESRLLACSSLAVQSARKSASTPFIAETGERERSAVTDIGYRHRHGRHARRRRRSQGKARWNSGVGPKRVTTNQGTLVASPRERVYWLILTVYCVPPAFRPPLTLSISASFRALELGFDFGDVLALFPFCISCAQLSPAWRDRIRGRKQGRRWRPRGEPGTEPSLSLLG